MPHEYCSTSSIVYKMPPRRGTHRSTAIAAVDPPRAAIKQSSSAAIDQPSQVAIEQSPSTAVDQSPRTAVGSGVRQRWGPRKISKTSSKSPVKSPAKPPAKPPIKPPAKKATKKTTRKAPPQTICNPVIIKQDCHGANLWSRERTILL